MNTTKSFQRVLSVVLLVLLALGNVGVCNEVFAQDRLQVRVKPLERKSSPGVAMVGASSLASPGPLLPQLQLSPKVLQQLMDEAEQLYQARQDDQALALFSSLIELSPKHRDRARLRVGNIHQRSGLVGAALDAYRSLMGEASSIEQRALQLKAMINMSMLAVEQSQLSLARIEQLQRDEAVRLAAGLDRTSAQALTTALWHQAAEMRALMTVLGAWDETAVRQATFQRLHSVPLRSGVQQPSSLHGHRSRPAFDARSGKPVSIRQGSAVVAADVTLGPEVLIGGIGDRGRSQAPIGDASGAVPQEPVRHPGREAAKAVATAPSGQMPRLPKIEYRTESETGREDVSDHPVTRSEGQTGSPSLSTVRARVDAQASGRGVMRAGAR
ncbi:MAG: hypothetical protein Q4A16_03045 [Lautropia sp.]|nr:hypothetical protein [Lautropia sp.]